MVVSGQSSMSEAYKMLVMFLLDPDAHSTVVFILWKFIELYTSHLHTFLNVFMLNHMKLSPLYNHEKWLNISSSI